MPHGENEIRGLTSWKDKNPNEALKDYFCDVLEVADDRTKITLDAIFNKEDAINCGGVGFNKNQRLLKIGKEADEFFIWLYRVFIANNKINEKDKKLLWKEIRKQINTSAANIVTDDTVNYDAAIARSGVAQPLARGQVRVSKVISDILQGIHTNANLSRKFESTEIPLPKSMDHLLGLIQQGNEEQKQKAIAKLELLWEKYGEINNEAAFGEKRFEMNTLDILNKEQLQEVFSDNFQISKEKGNNIPTQLQKKGGVYNIQNVFGLKGSAETNIATLVSGSMQDKVRTGNEFILGEATQNGKNKNVDRFLKGIMAESLNKAMEKAIKMGELVDDEWNEEKKSNIHKNKKEIIKEIIQFAQKHGGVNFDTQGNSLEKHWHNLRSVNPVLQNVPYLMACSFSKAYQDSMKQAKLYTGQLADRLLEDGLDYQDIGARLTRIPAKDINEIVKQAVSSMRL
jgi:hypothetical protein